MLLPGKEKIETNKRKIMLVAVACVQATGYFTSKVIMEWENFQKQIRRRSRPKTISWRRIKTQRHFRG